MPLLTTRFLNVYDLRYFPGRHYYSASRRTKEELPPLKTDGEFFRMVPDAVSCFVILEEDRNSPKLLLTEEFRYPVGQYLLSVPAGLIDPQDREEKVPALAAARREIQEETGLILTEQDTLKLVSPLVFSSPGMTDESNALVLAVLRNIENRKLSQDGAVGGELFDGFRKVDEQEARSILLRGTDETGRFYPVYTWMALLYFVSGFWKD